jgi:hypothetical protein
MSFYDFKIWLNSPETIFKIYIIVMILFLGGMMFLIHKHPDNVDYHWR